MLWFERQVVTTLVSPLDDERRSAVEHYVDEALRSMPEHIRAGVAAQSLVLGGWERVRRPLARHGRGAGAPLEPLERSRLGPVRQYVRLLRSLVLFAEHELAPGTGS